MTTSLGVLVYALFLGGAALALWVTVRFPRLGDGWIRAAAHAVAGVLVLHLVAAEAMGWVLAEETRLRFVVATVGIALPAVTYLLLGSLWMLRATRRLLPAGR